MARLKFGSLIVSGSGSLGGQTIQNSSGGMQIRNKPINKKAPTQAQQIIRGYNKTMQGAWRSMSQAQRDEWGTFAVQNKIVNKNGVKYPLSGHSLFLKLQFPYISNGLNFQLDPYKAFIGPFGAELIKNGDFANSDYWTLQSMWTIAGGKAIYFPFSVGNMQQSLSFTSGTKIRVEFLLSGITGTAKIAFANEIGTACMSGVLNGFVNLPNGSYSFDVEFIVNGTGFRVYGSNLGSIFQLDNLSIKEIL